MLNEFLQQFDKFEKLEDFYIKISRQAIIINFKINGIDVIDAQNGNHEEIMEGVGLNPKDYEILLPFDYYYLQVQLQFELFEFLKELVVDPNNIAIYREEEDKNIYFNIAIDTDDLK